MHGHIIADMTIVFILLLFVKGSVMRTQHGCHVIIAFVNIVGQCMMHVLDMESNA